MTVAAAFTGRASRPLRYLIAGGVNTAFGLAVYPALLWGVATLRDHYLIALGIAQGLSVMFAYMVYRLWVFRSTGPVAREFATFSSFYLVNYAANWAALPLLVEVAGIPPVLAQVAFSIVVIAGSWFWHSRLTFRSSAS